jgi:hypothetical protein
MHSMNDQKTSGRSHSAHAVGRRGRRLAVALALSAAISVGAVGVATAAGTHHGTTGTAHPVTATSTKKSTTKSATHACPNMGTRSKTSTNGNASAA